MNNKPNNPGDLILINRSFSWRTTWTVNRWLFLAAIVSALCDVIFLKETKLWPLGWRLAIVAVEFFAILLWTRSMMKWIRGMDELDRSVALTVLLFATSASFFVFVLWLRLDRAGFFNAVFGPPIMNGTWGIASIAHVYVLLSSFYGIGHLIFNRRYK